MKTMKFLTYAVFVLFLGFAISSCKGDDGADGVDGVDGVTGPAGADGQDGQDGNANVQTLTFDTSGESGSYIDMAVPEFTADVIENDAILSYFSTNGTSYYGMPGSVNFGDFDTSVLYNVGSISIDFENPDGTAYYISAGDIVKIKVVIIESPSKSISGKQEILTELKNAGIEINDYHEVCDYYGINPK